MDRCFNGAATLSSRKSGIARRVNRHHFRFNGAATLSSRKFGVRESNAIFHAASMGPRRYRRGNVAHKKPNLYYLHELQWGRDVIVAEIVQNMARRAPSWWLQWGRDVIVAEMLSSGAAGSASGKLQWGRDVIVAEIGAAAHPAAHGKQASMGPRRYRRGNQVEKRLERNRKGASMGPRRYRRGNWARSIRPQFDSSLQWGRDVIVAEIRRVHAALRGTPPASMGPRRYRRGNVQISTRGRRTFSASMGPRRYRRGNHSPPMRMRGISPLQWGRDVIVAEMMPVWASCSADTGCFNGAATLSSRKSVEASLDGVEAIASMGPRRYRRGNPNSRISIETMQKLQWGRDVIVAEITAIAPRPPSPSSFNGAATLSSRKSRHAANCRQKAGCFNGAATLSSRKCVGIDKRGIDSVGLQWGRDVIVAEIARSAARTSGTLWLQWGRDVIVAEMARR